MQATNAVLKLSAIDKVNDDTKFLRKFCLLYANALYSK